MFHQPQGKLLLNLSLSQQTKKYCLDDHYNPSLCKAVRKRRYLVTWRLLNVLGNTRPSYCPSDVCFGCIPPGMYLKRFC